MKMSYYEIGDLMVMILNINGVYEYYLRDKIDTTDVFTFAFGIDVEFSEEELQEREDYLWDCYDAINEN